jgi:hypothetical protein
VAAAAAAAPSSSSSSGRRGKAAAADSSSSSSSGSKKGGGPKPGEFWHVDSLKEIGYDPVEESDFPVTSPHQIPDFDAKTWQGEYLSIKQMIFDNHGLPVVSLKPDMLLRDANRDNAIPWWTPSVATTPWNNWFSYHRVRLMGTATSFVRPQLSTLELNKSTDQANLQMHQASIANELYQAIQLGYEYQTSGLENHHFVEADAEDPEGTAKTEWEMERQLLAFHLPPAVTRGGVQVRKQEVPSKNFRDYLLQPEDFIRIENALRRLCYLLRDNIPIEWSDEIEKALQTSKPEQTAKGIKQMAWDRIMSVYHVGLEVLRRKCDEALKHNTEVVKRALADSVNSINQQLADPTISLVNRLSSEKDLRESSAKLAFFRDPLSFNNLHGLSGQEDAKRWMIEQLDEVLEKPHFVRAVSTVLLIEQFSHLLFYTTTSLHGLERRKDIIPGLDPLYDRIESFKRIHQVTMLASRSDCTMIEWHPGRVPSLSQPTTAFIHLKKKTHNKSTGYSKNTSDDLVPHDQLIDWMRHTVIGKRLNWILESGFEPDWNSLSVDYQGRHAGIPIVDDGQIRDPILLQAMQIEEERRQIQEANQRHLATQQSSHLQIEALKARVRMREQGSDLPDSQRRRLGDPAAAASPRPAAAASASAVPPASSSGRATMDRDDEVDASGRSSAAAAASPRAYSAASPSATLLQRRAQIAVEKKIKALRDQIADAAVAKNTPLLDQLTLQLTALQKDHAAQRAAIDAAAAAVKSRAIAMEDESDDLIILAAKGEAIEAQEEEDAAYARWKSGVPDGTRDEFLQFYTRPVKREEVRRAKQEFPGLDIVHALHAREAEQQAHKAESARQARQLAKLQKETQQLEENAAKARADAEAAQAAQVAAQAAALEARKESGQALATAEAARQALAQAQAEIERLKDEEKTLLLRFGLVQGELQEARSAAQEAERNRADLEAAMPDGEAENADIHQQHQLLEAKLEAAKRKETMLKNRLKAKEAELAEVHAKQAGVAASLERRARKPRRMVDM